MATTFNVSLAEKLAQMAAYETSAALVTLTYSPICDLGLDPRWSRMYENSGEDPYLGAQMVGAIVRGYQGTDREHVTRPHIGGCAKHYLGYGAATSGKDRTPSVIPQHFIREYHLPPFKAAIDAGVLTIMASSGIINRVTTHANHFLLTELLKEELGFDGIVISDWGDLSAMHWRDHMAASERDATAKGINAGVDIIMVPYGMGIIEDLKALVNSGVISKARLDDAVRRILRTKMRLNLWNAPYGSPADFPEFATAASKALSYQAAAESITLLKNDKGALPLPPSPKILVCGPNSNVIETLVGGWGYMPNATEVKTIYQAVNLRVPGAVHVPGVSYPTTGTYHYWADVNDRFNETIAAAKSADYVIVCLGENKYEETAGNLWDLTLSDNQLDLGRALIATGKPVIVVLNGGRPRLLDTIWDGAAAVLQTYIPGP
jgi:beta-glucosidase